MTKTKLKSCFISAPVRVDTSALRGALQARGVRWTDAVAAKPGSSILDTIEAAIGRSDFVCVVLPADTENRSVLFEMGLARGLKRPMLVFAEQGALTPSYLQGVAYARVAITDHNAVAFHLDAFLKHADKTPSTKGLQTRKGAKPVDVRWARQELTHLKILPPKSRATALEQLVSRLFEASGATVSLRGEPDIGADMAVWIDDLQSTTGNPLIVEVKMGRITERRLRETEEQMQLFIPKVHARAGLIIYYDLDEKRVDLGPPTWPLILRFSVREFIELIANGQFASEVIHKRNELVHGTR